MIKEKDLLEGSILLIRSMMGAKLVLSHPLDLTWSVSEDGWHCQTPSYSHSKHFLFMHLFFDPKEPFVQLLLIYILNV